MSVFQVYSPGLMYRDEVGDSDQESFVLVMHLQSTYTEANLAFLLFEEASRNLSIYMRARSKGERNAAPRAFMMQAPLMHARSFLYSLDNFYSVLIVMEKKPNTSGQFGIALNNIETEFPALRDIRNSAHHMEDRIRRKKTGEKNIVVQPTVNESFVTSGQAMILDSLNGNKYGTTLASGQYAELEVSDNSMRKLQAIYQRLLDGLKWQDLVQWPSSEPRPIIE